MNAFIERLKYHFIALGQSFYNPELYHSVVHRWKGFGAFHIFVLSLLTSLLLAILVTSNIARFAEEKLPNILAQMPDIRIEEGLVIVKNPQTQPVKITVDKDVFAYIDTTVSEDTLRQQKAILMVGANYMLIRSPDGSIERKPFDKIKSLVLNRQIIEQKWPSSASLIFVLWPIFIVGQFISLLIIAVVISACSFGITAMMDQEYDFEVRMRIAAIAMTPPLILSKILAIGLHHNTTNWFDILLSLLYFYVILITVQSKKNQEL
jgi:hypothetical protein